MLYPTVGMERGSVMRTRIGWASAIAVLGLAFGARGRTNRRTELIVLITPRVIRGRDDGEAVTRELREKLRLTVPVAARGR